VCVLVATMLMVSTDNVCIITESFLGHAQIWASFTDAVIVVLVKAAS
jgi:hypothetical protein